MLRVGRCTYDKKNKKNGENGIIFPTYENFTQIKIMTEKYSEYFELSPYVLTDEYGRIMENIYQFSKAYETVKSQEQYASDGTLMWKHPSEIHVDENGNLTKEYWNWREKGMNNKHFVRYPVGHTDRHKCLYALSDVDKTKKLDYVETRKQIYISLYIEMAKKTNMFKLLKEKLDNGENLLIIEVDGPHQESLQYYKDKYNVDDSFIQNNTMLVTDENISIMLNDTKHPFGHCYCLAMALL